MFSEPYKNIAYFGLWASETADDFGRRDALAVLYDAVRRCAEEEARTDDVRAALDYLKTRTARHWHFRQFERALAINHPVDRFKAAASAYESICRQLGVT